MNTQTITAPVEAPVLAPVEDPALADDILLGMAGQEKVQTRKGIATGPRAWTLGGNVD